MNRLILRNIFCSLSLRTQCHIKICHSLYTQYFVAGRCWYIFVVVFFSRNSNMVFLLNTSLIFKPKMACCAPSSVTHDDNDGEKEECWKSYRAHVFHTDLDALSKLMQNASKKKIIKWQQHHHQNARQKFFMKESRCSDAKSWHSIHRS